MSISLEDAQHVARLAKIRLSDDELDALRGELATILAFVDRLESVDVSGVVPTAQVTGLTDAVRHDVVRAFEDSQALVGLAPRSADGSFVVRAVHS